MAVLMNLDLAPKAFFMNPTIIVDKLSIGLVLGLFHTFFISGKESLIALVRLPPK
jgi:hypothetical protein